MSSLTEGLDLDKGEWAVYERGGPAHDGPWEFVRVIESPDDPGGAARRACVEAWAAGEHAFLVVGDTAHEFKVTLGCEEVGT